VRNKGQEDQHGPHRDIKPDRLPETTPIMPSGDYSYTLEIVMNMQLAIGKLTEAVDRLKTDQADQGKKLDSISHKIYAAIAILTLLGMFLGIFGKSIAEIVVNRLVPAVSQPQQAVPIQQQQAVPTPLPTPRR
jgi:hypothetical protein